MYYIGIDPSTKSTGYAVLTKDKELITYGKIEGIADDPKSFLNLHTQLNQLFLDYAIEGIFCEDQFFGKNIDTLKKIVRPTGIVILLAGQHDLPIELVKPSQWRKLFNGKGNASKRDSFALAQELYPGHFTSFNKQNDITDAIGLASACVDTYGQISTETVLHDD